MKKIVFIGGGFFGDIEKYILKYSSGVIQNAADTFQKNILDGMRQVSDENIVVLNLPFVGSYPNRFKKIWFKSFFNKKILSYGFINITGLKLFSRFFVTVKALLAIKPNSDDCIIIYSVHTPFLAAVMLYKKVIDRNIKVVLIVPDLPEYMTSDANIFIRFLKYIQSGILKQCYKGVDGYVFLTKYMHERIPAETYNNVVVEGVSKLRALSGAITINKSIFYSGTLDSRYGIKELIQAVESMDIDAQLFICGEGNSKNYVLDASKRSNRIKYLGQLPRKEVLLFQEKSMLLVNPRADIQKFTRYSFPSKVMEYMCAGRPVLMYPLPGIPEEYYEHCFCFKGSGIEGMRESLEKILSMDRKSLDEIGLRAREFVLNEKSGLKQSQKIFDLINKL
jgi:glycosyltransferase involved in cell wall biosynthesis